MISGGITALGAHPQWHSDWIEPGWMAARYFGPDGIKLAWYIAVGAIMAATLNAASNALNQITDLVNDRVNKPERPIPSGRLSIREAWGVTLVLWALALFESLLVNWQCFAIVFVASFFIYGYSAEPFRTKRRGWLANFTIAVPRGILLKVAGWSTVKHVFAAEPWYIGLIFGVFLLGASSTKDFSDIDGDREDGCKTLPVLYGAKKAAYMIAPFFILPFPLIPLGASLGILTGNAVLLWIMGIGLSIWGAYTVWLILKDPDELTRTENHPSWKHMYMMMMAMQIGFAISYVL